MLAIFPLLMKLLDFIQGRSQAASEEEKQKLVALHQEVTAFMAATTPDYQKVSPWVNNFVALIRPSVTVFVLLVMIFYPERGLPYQTAFTSIILSWFVSRGIEKIVLNMPGNSKSVDSSPVTSSGSGSGTNGRNGKDTVQ